MMLFLKLQNCLLIDSNLPFLMTSFFISSFQVWAMLAVTLEALETVLSAPLVYSSTRVKK